MNMDLYQESIVSAARTAKEPDLLPGTPLEAMVDNPLCGDRVTVQFALDPQGRIAQVGHKVRGCLLCQAAMAALRDRVIGEPVSALAPLRDQVAAMIRDSGPVPWTAMAMFEPVRAARSRHECVILPFDAAVRAVTETAG